MAIINKKKKTKINEFQKRQLIKEKLRQLSDEERDNLFDKIKRKIDNQTFSDNDLDIFFALCSYEFM
ncbi:hypothetical protein [Clostridium paraputrificum]|jgi:hypothetical protein|uniref:hypothetical protein n=1 Tax=Clostridium paraputrificum TaxID=29363 RepID=UPI002FCD9217